VIVRREAPLGWALAAGLAVACAMAQPTSATPTAPALVCALGALLAATSVGVRPHRAVLVAGALVALTAAWRLDFAVYGAAAVLAALTIAPHPLAERVKRAALFGLSATLLGAAVYAPFAAAIGPADLYGELLGDSLGDRDFWTLPFPVAYGGSLRGWPPASLAEDAKDLLGFYVPMLLVAGLALTGAMAILGRRRSGEWPAATLGLLALGAGGLAYLLSRNDEFHTTPMFVALSMALALAIGHRWSSTAGRIMGFAAMALLGLLTAYGVLNRVSALVQPPDLVSLDLPAADGTKVPPREARALELTVRKVRQVVPPDRPIYTITRRSDLVRFNQPLVYVLADRDNPTRIEYGLQTSPERQRELVRALRRAKPGAVVRWNDPITTFREPNLRGRPSGSRALDAYVADSFRLLERFGEYEVLVPR